MSRMTTKGQVTVPKAVRERLGVKPGDELEFVEKNGDIVVKRATEESPFDKWVGYLKHLKGKRTDEIIREMRGE